MTALTNDASVRHSLLYVSTKFVFMSWLGPSDTYIIQNFDQLSQLFTIYALGFIAVYAVFLLMYLHAYKSRHQLALTELEVWDTKHEIRESIIFCCVGALSPRWRILCQVSGSSWRVLRIPRSELSSAFTKAGATNGARRFFPEALP